MLTSKRFRDLYKGTPLTEGQQTTVDKIAGEIQEMADKNAELIKENSRLETALRLANTRIKQLTSAAKDNEDA